MAWSDWVACALLGTERQALPAMTDDGALGQLLERLKTDDHDVTLLRTAGTMALWRRAGQALTRDTTPLPPCCEPDTVPCCEMAASEHLALMLQGHYQEFLPEWLGLLRSNNQRVPEGLLPELLTVGAEKEELQAMILPVLGQRGRWLAGFNASWGCYTVEKYREGTWETGCFEERLALLRQLRTTQPEQGVALLNATWTQEPVSHRRKFIATLATGLNPGDEPFLEAALDDRNKNVRAVAADLLARLPDSRLVRRMTERSAHLLGFQKGRLLKRGAVEVVLPADDAALQRDGVTGKPPAPFRDVGEKAWRLSEIISAVPPKTWCQRWERTPEEILAAGRKNEWWPSLLRGWAIASCRHHDPDWALALLPFHLNNDELTGTLAATLPSVQLEGYLLSQLAGKAKNQAEAMAILRHLERPWGIELSRAVLDKIRQRVSEDKQPDWRLVGALTDFAQWISPRLGEEAMTSWPTTTDQWLQWESSINEFLDRLRFRCAMREALASAHSTNPEKNVL